MTCIAWDGKTLASDKRVTEEGLARTVTKIRRINGLLVGATGLTWAGREMLAWVERGRKPEDFPASQRNKDDWAGTIVIEGTHILTYDRGPYPIEIEDPTYAIGSGRDYALAAMHCGKTAAEAVEIAALFETGCGNGVDTLELE